MDHLPLPANARLSPVIVRYKCKEPYDEGLPFDYPQRHGWEVLHSPYGITYLHNGEEPGADELEGFLQNWLYFGLLHEIFDDKINLSDFIRELDDGTKVITSEPLNDALIKLTDYFEGLRSLPPPVQTAATIHMWAVLEHTSRISLNSIRRNRKTVTPELWMSIAVLAECVETHVYKFDSNGSVGSWRNPGNPPLGRILVEEMKEKGWCPFDVKRIDCTSNDMSSLYYLANMPPPREELNHSHCTGDLCVWMTIGESYKMKHTHEDCNCESFEDVSKVISVLKGEGIPLIQSDKTTMSGEKDGRPFKIIDSQNGPSFVAISHVWAEGLGNPHSNALPECSLGWISDLVNRLPGPPPTEPIPFWVDTVCVPIKPIEMHTRAMNRLREPYMKASKVLVLDSYLYTKKFAEMSAMEAWCRVLICSWSRRLWTFQESRLAKQLYFQFADGAINLEELFFERTSHLAEETLSQKTMIAYRGHNVLKEWDPDFRSKPDVRDMRESLKARAVSVASDEALCVFAVMFMDLEMVTVLPAEERMPAFWRNIDEIPIGLIFSTTQKKLTLPGLHWAPESFLGDLDTAHWYIEQWPPLNGVPTEHGLEIKVPGYIMDANLLLWEESFDVIFVDSQVQLRDECGVFFWIELEKPWNPAREHFPGQFEQLAILLISPMSEPQHQQTWEPFTFMPGVQGVIGVMPDGPDGKAFQGYRHVIMHRYSEALQEIFQSVFECVELYIKFKLMQLTMERGMITEPDSADEPGSDGEHGLDNELNADIKLNSGADQGEGVEPISENEPDSKKEPCADDGTISDNQRDSSDEQGAKDELESDDEPVETPETFMLTDERRVEVQEFAEDHARSNAEANRLVLAYGRIQGKDEADAIKQYGHHARFQLQMRQRNRIRSCPRDTTWCID